MDQKCIARIVVNFKLFGFFLNVMRLSETYNDVGENKMFFL